MNRENVRQIIQERARENFNNNSLAWSREELSTFFLAEAYFDNRTDDEIVRDRDLDITLNEYYNWVLAEYNSWLLAL